MPYTPGIMSNKLPALAALRRLARGDTLPLWRVYACDLSRPVITVQVLGGTRPGDAAYALSLHAARTCAHVAGATLSADLPESGPLRLRLPLPDGSTLAVDRCTLRDLLTPDPA